MKIDDFQPFDQPGRPGESLKKETDNFQTPEEVAATDDIEQAATVPTESLAEDDTDTMANKTKRAQSSHKQGGRFDLHWPPGKKEWAVIVVAVLLIGLGIFLLLDHHSAKPVATLKPAPVKQIKKSTTVASRLTGVQVTPALAQLPVTGVMIENSDGARPQSGLSQAGVVFEALAEGGITRFLALYEEGQPSSIGPVRSARPYYIDWLLPFDAAYAHVGGSPQALSEIQSANVRDMNQFYNSGAYTRITSRQAPHNVYTSMANLLSLEKSKGWTTSSFTGFSRKSDNPSKTPTVTSINLNIAGPDMAVHYQYDPTLDSYKRSEAGAPMIDSNTNQQLEPKVVVAMVVPWTNGPLDASGAHYTDYSDIGSGTVYIFQDGTVTQGVWSKTAPTSQIQFKTTSGSTIKLNAGQTWITAMGSPPEVTYSN
jgi:hypothetical protein